MSCRVWRSTANRASGAYRYLRPVREVARLDVGQRRVVDQVEPALGPGRRQRVARQGHPEVGRRSPGSGRRGRSIRCRMSGFGPATRSQAKVRSSSRSCGDRRQADGPEQGGVLLERLRPAGVLVPRAEHQGLEDEVPQGRREVPGPAAEDAGEHLVVLLQPDGGPRVAFEQEAVADDDADVPGGLDEPAEGEPLAGRDAADDGERGDVGVAELVALAGPVGAGAGGAAGTGPRGGGRRSCGRLAGSGNG